MMLRDALKYGSDQLQRNPDLRDNAARDAALLLRHALGISHAVQLAEPERELTPAQQAAFDALIQRRLANEPIQYITGEQEFYGLALGVTPAVLIPRPETEILVEAVLREVKRAGLQSALRILDVGTGSGPLRSRWPTTCPARASPPSISPPRRSKSPRLTPRATGSPAASASSRPICSTRFHRTNCSLT